LVVPQPAVKKATLKINKFVKLCWVDSVPRGGSGAWSPARKFCTF